MTGITINIVFFQDQPSYDTISDAIRSVDYRISLISNRINNYSNFELSHEKLGVYKYEFSLNKIPDARKPE